MKFVSNAILSAAMLGLMSTSVLAAEKVGDFALSGSLGVVSDYISRGYSQTYNKPAVQGVLEVAHPTGAYLGTSFSNVRFVPKGAPSDGATIEIDYYGGYRYEYSKGNTLDVGAALYSYPGGRPNPSAKYDFKEVYVKGNYDFLTASYYHSNDYFGGSGKAHYFTVGASYPLPMDVTLSANVGRLQFKNDNVPTYNNWTVGVSKSFVGLNFALTYMDTTFDSTKDPDKLAKSRVLLGVSKRF